MHDPNIKINFLSNAGAYGFVFYAFDTNNNNRRICVIKIVLLDENNNTDEDTLSVYIRDFGSKNVAPLSRFKEETDNSIILERDGDGVYFYGSELLDKERAMELIQQWDKNQEDETTSNYITKMLEFLNHDKVTHIGIFFTEPLVAIDVSEEYLTFSIESAVNLLKLACAGKIASDLKPANSIFTRIDKLREDKQKKIYDKRVKAITLASTEEEKTILEKIQVSNGTSISIDAGILIDRKENFVKFNIGLVNRYIQTNHPSSEELTSQNVSRKKQKEVTKDNVITDVIISEFITESTSINISEIQKYHVATMLDILYYDNPGTFWWLGSIIGDREHPRYIDKIGAIWCLLKSSSVSSRKSSRKSYSKKKSKKKSKKGGKTIKYKTRNKEVF